MNIDDVDFDKLIKDIPNAHVLGSPNITSVIAMCLFNDKYRTESEAKLATKCFEVLESMGYTAQDLFNGNKPSHIKSQKR